MDVLKGIDCSAWNGQINWELVKNSGISFCFIKACEGITVIDKCFAENFKNAKQAGLQVGLYHYGHCNLNPQQSATFFANAVNSLGLGYGDLPLILDIEVTDNSTDVDGWAMSFLDALHNITGHQVGIYSGEWFASTYLKNTMIKYPWTFIAKYSTQAPSIKWSVWQETQTGTVPGISGNVDIDELLSTQIHEAVTYDISQVVVKDKLFDSIVSNNNVYVNWGALNELGTQHTYKGNGVMNINGKDVQGIVYKGDTYLLWSDLGTGLKAEKVNWFITN